jgi:hypothetical protein
MKRHSPLQFFERLQALRSLACTVYDRAIAQGANQEQLSAAVAPVQSEYEQALSAGVENNLDEAAAAIEMFEAQAEAQAKYAAEIMEKAKDLRDTSQRLRERLAQSLMDRGEETRHGKLYSASLVEGIGAGGHRAHQLVIR